ncbi:MAG: NnrS family protein [Mesorhizobium sp.]|nr:MAG: NnrS family protein [Mesorhizobium sp.]
MPPILQYGFRPFFFLAALHAGVAIPVWLAVYFAGHILPGPFPGLAWHAHEMLFGYLGAVVTGFVLTAIPNWTGCLPLSGWPLAGLVALWLVGRVACAFVAEPVVAAAADLAFPSVLAFVIWREVVAGRNWKNAPVAAMISLFGVANALHHAENLGLARDALGLRLALGAAAMLIALIGGRIIPSFTRNWLVKAGETRLPVSFDRIDKAALVKTALAAGFWVAVPESAGAGTAMAAAGTLLAARLIR